MAELLAVAALHLAPVLRLGTVTREMTQFITVAAGDCVGITRLVTLFSKVLSRTAVATGTRRPGLNVGALECVS